jgi:hypothetical protein
VLALKLKLIIITPTVFIILTRAFVASHLLNGNAEDASRTFVSDGVFCIFLPFYVFLLAPPTYTNAKKYCIHLFSPASFSPSMPTSQLFEIIAWEMCKPIPCTTPSERGLEAVKVHPAHTTWVLILVDHKPKIRKY